MLWHVVIFEIKPKTILKDSFYEDIVIATATSLGIEK